MKTGKTTELVTHTERRASKKPRGSANFASSKQTNESTSEAALYTYTTRYGIFYPNNSIPNFR